MATERLTTKKLIEGLEIMANMEKESPGKLFAKDLGVVYTDEKE